METAPIGALSAGAVANTLGAPCTIAIGGVICLTASAVFWSRLSALRPQARELILAQQMAASNRHRR